MVHKPESHLDPLLEFWFQVSLALMRPLKDLAGGDDVVFGRLEDGVALAGGLDVPGGAEVGGVGFFGGFAGAGEVVDLGLDLAGGLVDALDLAGDVLVDRVGGEAEGLLAAGSRSAQVSGAG
ncbi:MAG TPA: hypothetical protein DHU96_32650 [Actinobacteria bacterium]|nr:hypothetical protein [Actinomycetota bacterium]